MKMMRNMNKVKKIAAKTARDFEVNDFLEYLGLEKRRTSVDYILPTLGILAGGAIVGAGIALLFAPSSGKRLRADMTQKIGELRERYLPEGSIEHAKEHAKSALKDTVAKELGAKPVTNYASGVTSSIANSTTSPTAFR